ncbi:hypothetical protein IW146_004665 [Coemansia sp. RSA 922]|nr:hypothetical protein H4S03_005833 [Coemansia sp. S3946]KAJ2046728.1 hypothetical protein H4S04_004870 [Coemansia sp. S16]KAJ2061224.1 hypothetical protein GGH13_006655 [Coemansia sp. S155-1]KAJ2112366.1 hypothetical protein IW146_004665 [Coemansia sp. RSA 922]KAJ2346742.1 hypothetical protein GGH92_003466 [Coemansia sp. RSA 2673]
MFKITALAYAVSLVAIQAYPVADFGAIDDGADLTKHDGCGGVGCGGSGIQFTASNLSPDLTFSTCGRFNLPGIQPCGTATGQPCATAALPQQAPPQEMPSQQAPPASGATPCDQAQGQVCPDSTQQNPPQQTPPQEMPPQQAPPTTPQGCNQAQGQACPDSAQQTLPQQAPSTPGVSPCDQAQDQACGSGGPTSLSFNNDQSNRVKASSYKETTLYYKHKDAKSFSKSGTSSTQLNYSKQ